MIALTETTHALELVTTGSAVNADWTALYVEMTSTGHGNALVAGNVASATTTTVVSSPGASGTTRKLSGLTVVNKHASVVLGLSLQLDLGGTNRQMTPTFSLDPGAALHYDGATWGTIQAGVTASAVAYSVQKIGAVTESSGTHHFLGLSGGSPGAWSPGSSGVNGRATDGTAAGDAGCLPVPTPTAGSNYLTDWSAGGNVTARPYLLDVLWVNNGLSVTLLTAQAITTPTLPTRDAVGSSNGVGCQIGILVTTATANVGSVVATVSYTDSNGNAGNSATITIPATAVAGTLVWASLAAGDHGVRSIESITLASTLTSGAISLVIAYLLPPASVLLVNAGGERFASKVGVKLWPGACLLPAYIPTTTTALTLMATATVETR